MKRIAALLMMTALLTGCACASETPRSSAAPTVSPSAAPTPSASAYSLPEELALDEAGVPLVEVYRTDLGAVETMSLESYLMGVVAGEMQNDWPQEALKAQAIIARTFALRFIADGGSKYEGAMLSTDVSEAQAYDLESVNERVRHAVQETEGMIILCQGQPIQAWFHAHAGGVTATAQEGLDYQKAEPPSTRSIQVRESDKAPEDVQHWMAQFPLGQVQQALDALGGGDAAQLAIGERGPSGRVLTFTAGDGTVSAVALRMQLGSTTMKSTLLSDLTVSDGIVTMTGSGYGHGVGMSQWGAYEMAAEGKTAQEIVDKFYQNVEIQRVYGG